MNWEAAVGSRYRVRSGSRADIRGVQRHGDNLILVGVVKFGEANEKDYVVTSERSWINGNDAEGDTSLDLMECVSGPGKCK